MNIYTSIDRQTWMKPFKNVIAELKRMRDGAKMRKYFLIIYSVIVWLETGFYPITSYDDSMERDDETISIFLSFFVLRNDNNNPRTTIDFVSHDMRRRRASESLNSSHKKPILFSTIGEYYVIRPFVALLCTRVTGCCFHSIRCRVCIVCHIRVVNRLRKNVDECVGTEFTGTTLWSTLVNDFHTLHRLSKIVFVALSDTGAWNQNKILFTRVSFSQN